MKKISEWLSEHGSHDIYAAEAVAESFKTETGVEPCWPTHTVHATRAAIARRGLGGDCKGEGKQLTAYGYEIAASLALKHANFRSQMMGRGSLFRDCIAALAEAGK